MKDSSTDTFTGIEPAPLPAPLRNRMLCAMIAAEQDTREDLDVECTLARLQPAPLPELFQKRCHTRMQQTQRSTHLRPYTHHSWWRMATVASIAIFGILGISITVHDTLGGAESQGLARRSVLERKGGDTVQWGEDGMPIRRYEVMYEDSFVLSGEDDTTLVIRVPNKTIVSVKGEVI